jgi:hypothetical protein
MAGRKTAGTGDFGAYYEHKLDYMVKNSGWEIFKSIYWSVFVFIMGAILFSFVPNPFPETQFAGLAVMVFAMFYLVYGFAVSMHFRMMRARS